MVYAKELVSRLTTCKRLSTSLPKLSLVTLFPPETAGYQVGRIYGRTCQYPSGLISWGYRGEYFWNLDMGKVWKRLSWWMVGSEPTTQKKHGLVRTPHMLRNWWGIRLARLTTWKRLANSLLNLSLITHIPQKHPRHTPQTHTTTCALCPRTYHAVNTHQEVSIPWSVSMVLYT